MISAYSGHSANSEASYQYHEVLKSQHRSLSWSKHEMADLTFFSFSSLSWHPYLALDVHGE